MTVIVSYVPSTEGRAALDFGIRTARERGEDLIVVDGSGGRGLEAAADQVPYAGLPGLLEPSGVPFTVQDPAPPGQDVDDVAGAAVEDPEADLIVIGVRHRSAVGKFLLGSSAQRLILGAECPVVVVKAPQHTTQAKGTP